MSDLLATLGGDLDDEQLKDLAQSAENAERYEDMCTLMKALVMNTQSSKRQLSVEERNLLSVAFKNVIGHRRASWRSLNSTEPEPIAAKQVEIYKEQIQKELLMCSTTILDLLKDILIPNCDEDAGKVFYLKMSGDYYRYLAEAIHSDSSYGIKAQEDYEKAREIAEETMEATDPVRLGLALNYSVCHYEILKQPEKACEMAKKAFDSAISCLDSLKESDYKDSTLIMQLLRDNLTLWTSQDQDDDDDVKLEDLDDK